MPKHVIPETTWPDRETAQSSLLFQPIAIGPIQSRTRTWVPAMVPWRSTENGEATPAVLDWYERFARGKPGVLVVEATGIRDIPSGPLLRIGNDGCIPGLRELVRRVREASDGQTRLLIQVIDFLRIRRRPDRRKFLERFLEITDRHRRGVSQQPGMEERDLSEESAVREALLQLSEESLRSVLTEREWESLEFGFRERVTDTEQPHIANLPQVLPGLFATASRRAREAGFDGVELHYAHAYTMASFLSRRNNRTDGYGGSPEARVRLPLEVFREVRRTVGSDYPVGCRFLGDEVISAGSTVEDAEYYGVEFAAAGMDFLSVSKGGKFEDARQPAVGEAAYPYTGVSGHECMPTVRIEGDPPFGRNLPLSRSIRQRVREAGFRTPVVGAGGIQSFELAEGALQRGDCDLVGAARQSLADPDWFLKMELGRGAEVRRCVFTNYCEALDQKHKEVTCQLWDREFRPGDAAVAVSQDGRRRLVAPPWTP